MKKIGIFLIILLFISSMTGAFSEEKKVLLKVIVPELAWSDSHLEEKLHQRLTQNDNIRIRLIDNSDSEVVAFPTDYFNNDSLLNYGKELGGRYVMIVHIESQRLEKRKTFHIPLVFHKYQTFGIIEGELRIFDVDRNKLIRAEPFRVEKKGPRIFQATMDDEIGDPDIHITAPDKIVFFDKLEDETVRELFNKSRAIFGIR